MHLRSIDVNVKGKYGDKALAEVKLDRDELNHVLWDWYLHRELASTGKSILVNKTPSDVFIAEQIKACWPDARFIFLLRHPVAIARSRHALRPQDSVERNEEMVLRYATALEAARASYDGHTVRYEDLAADPEAETRRLCAFLGVPWEPAMLEYGQTERRFKAGQVGPRPAARPAAVRRRGAGRPEADRRRLGLPAAGRAHGLVVAVRAVLEGAEGAAHGGDDRLALGVRRVRAARLAQAHHHAVAHAGLLVGDDDHVAALRRALPRPVGEADLVARRGVQPRLALLADPEAGQ
jgi:hypothetical protein